jgi:hypothetical protein
MAEDRVEDMVCLDVVLDSMKPLSVVVTDLDELFPTFEVEPPQEFTITPIICQCVEEGVEVGDFLIEVGKKCEETKLFVDSGELVVGKDSFFKGKDFLPIHLMVK